MSITNQTAKSGPFIGASYPQVVPTQFPFQNASDLLVINVGQTSGPHDPPLVLALGSDYTVTGGNYTTFGQMLTGNVTLMAGGANSNQVGDTFWFLRNVPINQTTSAGFGVQLTGPQIEIALDKLATISQELQEQANRSLRFEDQEVLDGTLNLAARKGNSLAFDSTTGAPIFIPTSGVSGILPLVVTSNISTLRALSVTSVANNAAIEVLGYYSPGDGGGGIFYFNTSSSAGDNGGTVIAPAVGAGRWIRVTSNYIDIRWFGAKGDGVTDDSVAIQTSINQATETIFPSAPYLVNSVINLVSNVRLIGNGSATILPGSGCASYCIKGVGLSNVTITNLTVRFAAGITPQVVLPQGTYGSASAIYFENCTNIALSNLRGGGMFGQVNLYNCQDSWCKDSIFSSPNAGVAAVADSTVTGTALIDGIEFTGNEILDGGDDGIAILSRGTGVVQSVLVSGNYITKTNRLTTTSAAAGCRVAVFNTGSATNVSVIGNVFEDMVDEAIRFSNTTYSTCSNNVTKGYGKRTGGVGAYWFSFNTRSIFRGNLASVQGVNNCAMTFDTDSYCTISENVALGALAAQGIAYFTTFTNGNVHDNLFHNTTSYGMQFTNNCTNNTVYQNDVSVFSTLGISIGTDNSSIFYNNPGYVTRNTGTATVTTGTQAIAVSHGLSAPRTAKIKVLTTQTTTAGAVLESWYDTVTSTQFTIRFPTNTAGNVSLFWTAWEE